MRLVAGTVDGGYRFHFRHDKRNMTLRAFGKHPRKMSAYFKTVAILEISDFRSSVRVYAGALFIIDLKDYFVVSDIGFVVNLTPGSSAKIAAT